MKKRADLWMPLYITDYLGDTTHLTTAQHGAYLLLLMSCWKRGATLPDDDVQLAQMARCDTKAWRAMRPVIAEFFDIEDGTWLQKRLTAEYLKAGENVDSRRKAGRAGAAKRWGTDGDKPIANAIANAIANGMANGQQTASQTDAPEAWQTDRPSPSPSVKPKTPEATHPTHSTFGGSAGTDRVASPADREAQGQGTSDSPPARRGELAGLLRGLGVVCTYAHPTVVAWANGMAVSDDEAREAVAVARMRKPAPAPIPMGYLEPILAEMRNPPAGGAAADAGVVVRWWETEAGTQEQAARLGLTARGGEGWPEFRGRIRDALSQRKAVP